MCRFDVVAHDFRVFFIGHKDSIEARYTTNKGILPRALVNEMREAFKRSQEHLDLEGGEEDPLEKQKEEVKLALEKMSPEQFEQVQELVRVLTGCMSSPNSVWQQAKRQNNSSSKAGNSLEPYLMVRSYSKNRIRYNISGRQAQWD